MTDPAPSPTTPPELRLGLVETYRSLLRLLPGHEWRLALGFAILTTGRILGMLQPPLWGYLLDAVLATRDHAQLAPVFGAVVALAVARSVSARTGWDMIAFRFLTIQSDLRAAAHARLLSQGSAFHQRHRRGDLLDRVVRDLPQATNSLRSLLLEHCMTVFQLVLASALFLYFDARLMLLALGPMLGAVVALRWYLGQFEERYRAYSTDNGAHSATFAEDLEALRVLRGFAREPEAMATYRATSDDLCRRVTRLSLDNTLFWGGLQVAGMLTEYLLLGYMAWLVVRGERTVGQLIVVQAYWSYLWHPLTAIFGSLESIQTGRASAERVLVLLDEPLDVAFPDTPPVALPEGPLAITFEHVSLTYPGGHRGLRDVNLVVPGGSRLALMGPNGAGKSTLVTLLLRARDPDQGRILLGDADLKDLPRTQYPGLFGPVEQDPVLFHRSLRENIRLARPEASDSEVEEAARRADAHDFIVALPRGYETEVGERGARLSGGQRQRVCIARAFLADPRILILDEATASVEAEAEAHLDEALRTLMEGRTTVVVTHKVHLAQACDRVAVVEEGTVTHHGTFDEVVAGSAWLREVMRLQVGAGRARLQGIA